MARHTCRRQITGSVLGFLALTALTTPRFADAAVAILSDASAPILVLIDADRLDTPLLARLVTAGFGSPHQFETGCEVVDAALLQDRLREARRVVALVSVADAALVQETWRGLGGRIGITGPSDAVPKDGPPDLRNLRDAMGDAAQGLQALEGLQSGVTAGAR